MTAITSGKRPFHHGDLRNALIEAAVDLARQGGATAIVLREAARRVGVSPNAAYRHFSALPELADAVCDAAQAAMAVSMQAEIALIDRTTDAKQNAVAYLMAVGRGYIGFALAEPGLFSAAFLNPKEVPRPDDPEAAVTPYELLKRSLDGLVAVGLLRVDDCEPAAATAWAAVHGLSLLLQGPLSGVPLAQRGSFIESCLQLVANGLVARD